MILLASCVIDSEHTFSTERHQSLLCRKNREQIQRSRTDTHWFHRRTKDSRVVTVQLSLMLSTSMSGGRSLQRESNLATYAFVFMYFLFSSLYLE